MTDQDIPLKTKRIHFLLQLTELLKTTYKLRHQPKLDYRLFIPPSQLYS